jgi:hypothetical protein
MAGVSITSPAALFVPPALLASPVPAPLYLFEFVPGTLAHFYPTGTDGTLRDREDHFHERTLTYASGITITVRTVASPRHGFPMQHDTDIMLGLLRLADQGGVTPEGSVIEPSYRAILRAAGREGARSGDDVAAVKRALARWTVTVETEAVLDFRDLARGVSGGSTHQLPVPPHVPERTTRTSVYPVLEYSYDAELRRGVTVDTIGHLQINPVWLSQSHAGIASWIDVDVHNSLRSPWAKRIYQHLASRAALGWRPDELLVLPLTEFLQALGVRAGRRASEDATSVTNALIALTERGVLRHALVQPRRKGIYDVILEGGEQLIGASRLRGSTAADSIFGRMLLAQLKGYGISDREARDLVVHHSTSALAALRYLQYHAARPIGKPVTHPAQWLRRAIAERYQFEEPSYRQWLAAKTRQTDLDAAPRNTPSTRIASSVLSDAPAPTSSPPLPPGILGTALDILISRGVITESAVRMYFVDCTPTGPTNGILTIALPDAFAISRISGPSTLLLEEILSTLTGSQVTVVLVSQ